LKTTLVVDIGNCHFGDFKKASEMIRIAVECGADLIKGQAFKPEDISGSMPKRFYEKCAFSLEQYCELIDIARYYGSDMFYSIFSTGFADIKAKQNYMKITASQSKILSEEAIEYIGLDREDVIVSCKDIPSYPWRNATVLWATEYLQQEINIDNLMIWRGLFKKFGYSDHTVGNRNCIAAANLGATIIEKHFTLKKEVYFAGIKFRDTVHGCNPIELENLAKAIK